MAAPQHSAGARHANYERHLHGIREEFDDLWKRWTATAARYHGLSLLVRRDLRLPNPFARVLCAAIFQHLHPLPNDLFTAKMNIQNYGRGPQPDQDLTFAELCPVSRVYYEDLFEAIESMEAWEQSNWTGSSSGQISQELHNARERLTAAECLLSTISVESPDHVSSASMNHIIYGWNKMAMAVMFTGQLTEEIIDHGLEGIRGGVSDFKNLPHDQYRYWFEWQVAPPPVGAMPAPLRPLTYHPIGNAQELLNPQFRYNVDSSRRALGEYNAKWAALQPHDSIFPYPAHGMAMFALGIPANIGQAVFKYNDNLPREQMIKFNVAKFICDGFGVPVYRNEKAELQLSADSGRAAVEALLAQAQLDCERWSEEEIGKRHGRADYPALDDTITKKAENVGARLAFESLVEACLECLEVIEYREERDAEERARDEAEGY